MNINIFFNRVHCRRHIFADVFETRFGNVSSNFRYHLGVLDYSVQALQYNAIQNENRATEIERRQMQHKGLGMISSNLLAV